MICQDLQTYILYTHTHIDIDIDIYALISLYFSGKYRTAMHLNPRLKEAEDARTTCVSIENLECSDQLRGALLQHADAMTEVYRNLNKMVADGVNEESQYAALFGQAQSFSSWYKARKKVANSMKSAAAANSS